MNAEMVLTEQTEIDTFADIDTTAELPISQAELEAFDLELDALLTSDIEPAEPAPVELSPETIAMRERVCHLHTQISREIAPTLQAQREARAQLFRRLEDRYCEESFEAVPAEPTEAELYAIESEPA